mgnify:CR=1 FL=1
MFCDSYIIYFGESRCLGTREVETCNCGGDTDKCTFYPEKRITKNSGATKSTMTREEAEALFGVKIVD